MTYCAAGRRASAVGAASSSSASVVAAAFIMTLDRKCCVRYPAVPLCCTCAA